MSNEVDHGEQTERRAEAAEAHRDWLREERMLDPKLNAWLEVTALPTYKKLTPPMQTLAKGLFNAGWAACNVYMLTKLTEGK